MLYKAVANLINDKVHILSFNSNFTQKFACIAEIATKIAGFFMFTLYV